MLEFKRQIVQEGAPEAERGSGAPHLGRNSLAHLGTELVGVNVWTWAHSRSAWWSRTSKPRGASTRSSADRKSTRLNSSHVKISYAVFCLKKKSTHKPWQREQ